MKQKNYAPVTPFERQTSHCPLYIAWLVLEEARDYFRTPIPEAFAGKLAHRAEAVFAGNPFWQRKYTSRHGRDYLLMTMRHWLAAELAKERPALFRDLPDSFKVGKPLPSSDLRPAEPRPGISPIRWAKDMPEKMAGTPRRRVRTSPRDVSGKLKSKPVTRFMHGCELLAVSRPDNRKIYANKCFAI